MGDGGAVGVGKEGSLLSRMLGQYVRLWMVKWQLWKLRFGATCWEEAVGPLPTLFLAIGIVNGSREVNCGGQYLGCNSENMLGLNLGDRNGIEPGLYRDRQANGLG